ncbi:MAG: hypothetical protein LBC98_07995, partial [Prevotellaceae bacterium]|nr:hypothetical protein [Prevotellaceae bacterium]
KVGNIFTEIGVCNKSEQANKILKSDFESYGDFEKNLRQMYRNAEYIVTWEKYNFWELLSSIYRINRILPFEEKLNIFFTDLFFDWEAYKTKEEYSAFYDKLNSSLDYRDSIMGNNMIAGFEEILKNRDHRKKALVIYNGPHAYRRTLEKKPAAAYIFEKYPGRVTNVMINWWAFLKEGIKLLSDGKWDASFMYLNNPSLGFDFENSPFGNDKFDQYVERDTVLKYNDIYEGFIFYGGIHRWNCVVGIPDIWKDAPDVEEMLRREHHIVGNDYSVGEWKKYYNDVRNVILDDVSLDSIKAKIYSWLEDDEKSEKYILNSAY